MRAGGVHGWSIHGTPGDRDRCPAAQLPAEATHGNPSRESTTGAPHYGPCTTPLGWRSCPYRSTVSSDLAARIPRGHAERDEQVAGPVATPTDRVRSPVELAFTVAPVLPLVWLPEQSGEATATPLIANSCDVAPPMPGPAYASSR